MSKSLIPVSITLAVMGTIALITFCGFAIQSCSTVAGAAVERKAFENSYQNSAARKSEIAAFEAQLVELDALLSDPSLDDSTRARMQGQRRALNIQLSRSREQLDSVYLK